MDKAAKILSYRRPMSIKVVWVFFGCNFCVYINTIIIQMLKMLWLITERKKKNERNAYAHFAGEKKTITKHVNA